MSKIDKRKKCHSNLVEKENDGTKNDYKSTLSCNADKTDNDSYQLTCETKWEIGEYRNKDKDKDKDKKNI